MILRPDGVPTKIGVTETRFDPRLVAMLAYLSDLLHQNGLGLICLRCDRLGMPDGVVANNDPASDVMTLSCGCARRVWHRKTGKETVHAA